MIYKVHYPDGTTKKHMYDPTDRLWALCQPSLDRVFYTRHNNNWSYFKIAEMNEEEIWVEEITADEYGQLIISIKDVNNNFAHFNILPDFSLRKY